MEDSFPIPRELQEKMQLSLGKPDSLGSLYALKTDKLKMLLHDVYEARQMENQKRVRQLQEEVQKCFRERQQILQTACHHDFCKGDVCFRCGINREDVSDERLLQISKASGRKKSYGG